MAEMNKAIRVINTAAVRKIAKRCGALFELENSLQEEFKDVKLRGFTSGSVVNNGRKEFIYKNVFEGESPEESQGLRKNWITQEAKRKSERAKQTRFQITRPRGVMDWQLPFFVATGSYQFLRYFAVMRFLVVATKKK